MADIDTVLARLTTQEFDEIHAAGPKGHLARHLIEALDRAAGGPDAARGLYVPDGAVNANGGQYHVLRDDFSEQIFSAKRHPEP